MVDSPVSTSRLLTRPLTALIAGSMLLALVAPAATAQVPPASGFSGTVAPSGVSIVSFTGTTAELSAAGAAANAVSVTVTVGGQSVTLVVGAPDFVNVAFSAAFPTGLKGQFVILKTEARSAPAPAGTSVAGRTNAEITGVVDGDTLDVRIGGVIQRVRLILVNTPEVFGGAECFGAEASAFTKSTLPVGSVVSLEKDVSETDRFGRLLRYVYLADGRMLNEVLVAGGYAQVATFPPDLKYQTRLLAAQTTARDARAGLWASCVATPTPTPPGGGILLYDPFGPDRDCSDFPTQAQAQDFYLAAGGPTSDRHRLDSDGDGTACEGLP